MFANFTKLKKKQKSKTNNTTKIKEKQKERIRVLGLAQQSSRGGVGMCGISSREVLYTTLVGVDQVSHTPGWVLDRPHHVLFFLFFFSFSVFLLFY
jgi:hypothetical protein